MTTTCKKPRRTAPQIDIPAFLARPDVLSEAQAAAMASLSLGYFRRLRREKRGPRPCLTVARRWYYRLNDVELWLEQSRPPQFLSDAWMKIHCPGQLERRRDAAEPKPPGPFAPLSAEAKATRTAELSAQYRREREARRQHELDERVTVTQGALV